MKTNKQICDEIFKVKINGLRKTLGKFTFNNYLRAAMRRVRFAVKEAGIDCAGIKQKQIIRTYATLENLTIPEGVNPSCWLINLYDTVDGLKVSRSTKIK